MIPGRADHEKPEPVSGATQQPEVGPRENSGGSRDQGPCNDSTGPGAIEVERTGSFVAPTSWIGRCDRRPWENRQEVKTPTTMFMARAKA